MVGDLFTYHEEDEEWIEKVNLAYEYMRESDDLNRENPKTCSERRPKPAVQ